MLVLALDTALDDCQAAVVECAAGRVVLRGWSGSPAQGDAEAIADHAAAALAAAGVAGASLARVVVTVGPGSFTGVRVGLAYAKGWGLALGVPVLGVGTLEGLARSAGPPVVAAVDARHGAVFAALFADAAFAPAGTGRMAGGEAVALAERAGARIVGPRSAVAALGSGRALARIHLGALAAAATGDPLLRPASATYLAAVDAAPQQHKSLVRA